MYNKVNMTLIKYINSVYLSKNNRDLSTKLEQKDSRPHKNWEIRYYCKNRTILSLKRFRNSNTVGTKLCNGRSGSRVNLVYLILKVLSHFIQYIVCPICVYVRELMILYKVNITIGYYQLQ